jgi:hypothetical protein
MKLAARPPAGGRAVTTVTMSQAKTFIDVLYHQYLERHPGYTTRAPPLSRGGRVQTGDQTITSPTPRPLGHDSPNDHDDHDHHPGPGLET